MLVYNPGEVTLSPLSADPTDGHLVRMDGEGPSPFILIEHTGEGAKILANLAECDILGSPAECRRVARMLLAAADFADGKTGHVGRRSHRDTASGRL